MVWVFDLLVYYWFIVLIIVVCGYGFAVCF